MPLQSFWMVQFAVSPAETLDGYALDADLSYEPDLTGVGIAVAVSVLPDAQALHLPACEPAIAIVIEGGQGLVAVVPKHPPGDRAEKLSARGDSAGPLWIPDEDAGVRAHPRPAFGAAVTRHVEA